MVCNYKSLPHPQPYTLPQPITALPSITLTPALQIFTNPNRNPIPAQAPTLTKTVTINPYPTIPDRYPNPNPTIIEPRIQYPSDCWTLDYITVARL